MWRVCQGSTEIFPRGVSVPWGRDSQSLSRKYSWWTRAYFSVSFPMLVHSAWAAMLHLPTHPYVLHCFPAPVQNPLRTPNLMVIGIPSAPTHTFCARSLGCKWKRTSERDRGGGKLQQSPRCLHSYFRMRMQTWEATRGTDSHTGVTSKAKPDFFWKILHSMWLLCWLVGAGSAN